MTMKETMEIAPQFPQTFTYGTFSCGVDTWRSVFSKGSELFSCDGQVCSNNISHYTNYYHVDWSKFQNLDILIIVDHGSQVFHTRWTTDLGHPSRARNILVVHTFDSVIAQQGQGHKYWSKRMREAGYNLHVWHVRSEQCGSIMWSHHLVTFCYTNHSNSTSPPSLLTTNPLRSCKNMIRTYGIKPQAYHHPKELKIPFHPVHQNIVGTYRGQEVYSLDGTFYTSTHNTWIQIPDVGIRRLEYDELVLLKGDENSRYEMASFKTLYSSLEKHVWYALAKVVTTFILPAPTLPPPQPIRTSTGAATHYSSLSTSAPWTWTPPDLRLNSAFYLKRIQNLHHAIKKLGPGHMYLLEEGEHLLSHHRTNYGEDGPQYLGLLWWEWPERHWQELREGTSMNFMQNPPPGLVLNQALKGADLEAAIKFSDE